MQTFLALLSISKGVASGNHRISFEGHLTVKLTSAAPVDAARGGNSRVSSSMACIKYVISLGAASNMRTTVVEIMMEKLNNPTVA